MPPTSRACGGSERHERGVVERAGPRGHRARAAGTRPRPPPRAGERPRQDLRHRGERAVGRRRARCRPVRRRTAAELRPAHDGSQGAARAARARVLPRRGRPGVGDRRGPDADPRPHDAPPAPDRPSPASALPPAAGRAPSGSPRRAPAAPRGGLSIVPDPAPEYVSLDPDGEIIRLRLPAEHEPYRTELLAELVEEFAFE